MFRRFLAVVFVMAFTVMVASGFTIGGHIGGDTGNFSLIYVLAIPMTFDTLYFTIANPLFSYSYTISGPDAGSYLLVSWRDIHINLMPDLDEPRGFYGGFPPQPLVLSSDTTGIDIELLPPSSGGFYGATTYNGINTGATYIIPHRSSDFSDLPHGFGILLDSLNINNTGNGSYTAFADSFGIYYVEAFMDLNSNLLHDANEPYGVYGGSSPQPIDIQQSNFPDNVNITLEDPSAASMPLVVLPAATDLGEIYPNPFNASTTIPFYLATTVKVELAVYDLLGREIGVLASGNFPAGTHQVVLQAGDMPSGLYFVALKTGTRTAVRRLLLLK
jgi:hypothetical protein